MVQKVVLLVEDDDEKAKRLESFLAEYSALNVVRAASYTSAARAILDGAVDLIILDITLPNFDRGAGESGWRNRALGGKDFLYNYADAIRNTPVIVVTQYETLGTGREAVSRQELTKDLVDNSGATIVGSVFFAFANDDWKYRLSRLLRRVSLT